ncbi:MAG: TetR/AcrR family transcriptional regulator [Candidatus Zixiibacteriota bacterium]
MARKPDYRKKDYIAKKSTELFAAKGYQNTTIEQIARESGYAVGTIYLYFDSKEEILATILTDFVEQFVDNILPEVNDIEDPVDRFKHVLGLFLKSSEEYPDRAWVLATELKKVIRPDSIVYKSEMGKLLSVITDSLKALQENGIVKEDIDLEKHTIMIYGIIESLTLYWVSEKESFSLSDSNEMIADMVLYGVLTDKVNV